MPFFAARPRRSRHILERAVAAIVVEKASRRGKRVRRAVGVPVTATNLVVIGVPIHVAGHEEVEPSVVVVIEKACRNGPASACHPGLGGHIRKRSIAVVVIQNVLAVTGHVQIGIPVVVVVADRHAHPVISIARVGQARRLGNVLKASVAVLAVQPVPIARIAPFEILRYAQSLRDPSAIHQEYIEQPIVVVVEQERRRPAWSQSGIFAAWGNSAVGNRCRAAVFTSKIGAAAAIAARLRRLRRVNLRTM